METVKRVAGADPEKRIPCQRLLVIANTSLGKEMYVATLVPSEAYLAQTKNWTVEPRTEKGELLDFSGRVFYSTLKGRITKVAKFENGRLLGNDIRLSETFGFGIYTEKNDLNLILSKIHFVEDVNKTTNMLRETSFLESLDETYKYLSKNGGVVMPGLGAKYIGDGYEDEYEFQLGNQVLMQMRHDLISEQFSVLKATEYGIEDGLSYTLNMTNIGASCIAALDNADALMIKNFGNSLTFLGAGMSVVGTFVAFTDGDISGIDVLGAVEAALNVVSTISILWPTVIAGPIGFYAGITACVVGTFCAILSDSMMIQVPLKNGKNVYVYVPATIN